MCASPIAPSVSAMRSWLLGAPPLSPPQLVLLCKDAERKANLTVKTTQFNETGDVTGAFSSRVILKYFLKGAFYFSLLLCNFSLFQMFFVSFKYLKINLVSKTKLLRHLTCIKRRPFQECFWFMTKELGTLTDTCVHLTFTPQGFPEDLLYFWHFPE